MVWASRPAWCLVALLASATVPAQTLVLGIHPLAPYGPCNGQILCKQPTPLEDGKAAAMAGSAAGASQGEKLVGGAEGSNAAVGGETSNAAATAESVAKDLQGAKVEGSDAEAGKAATKTEASTGDAEAGAAGVAGGAGGAKSIKAAAVSEGNAFGVGSAGSAEKKHASVATATAPASAYMAGPAPAPAPAEPPWRPKALGDYSPAFKVAIEKTLKSGKALRSAVQDLKDAAHMLKEKVAIPRIIEKALQ